MHRNLLMLCLVSMLILLVCPSAAFAAEYVDTDGHYAESSIMRWSDYSVIEGYNGYFRPDDTVTRGEMAAILNRTLKYTETVENSFRDLDEAEWYTADMLKLAAAGVMEGYQGMARPLDGITRQEAMVMMIRALGYENEFPSDSVLGYQDAFLISDWAYPAVSTLAAGGYITDCTTYLRPLDLITRAEVVLLLDNLVSDLWRSKGLYVTETPGNGVVASEQVHFLNSVISGDLIITGPAKLVIIENSSVNGDIINLTGADVRIYDEDIPNEDILLFSNYELPVLTNVPKNEYVESDFLTVDGRKYYMADDNGSIGIDVSVHNGEIDWDAVAEDGIDYVIIRIGNRGSTAGSLYEDECYQQNIKGAKAAGLDVGVYFFSQAISVAEAMEEAAFVLDILDGEDLDYPVYFDWEYMGQSDARTNDISTETLTACANAFCEYIDDHGYTPGIYIYGSLAYQSYDLSLMTDYDWWFAGYYDNPDFYYDFRMWQYSSTGSVAGISTNVDMNVCRDAY